MFDNLLAKNSRSFIGHYYYGRMSEASGSPEVAEKHYRLASEVSPNNVSVTLDLA